MEQKVSAAGGLALILAVLLPTYTPTRADGATVFVIVGKGVPIEDISFGDLRRAFLGLPTVVNGVRLVPLNQQPASSARVKFDERVLNLRPDRVGDFWVNRRIRDQSAPPRTASSPPLAAKVAASLPGAITYVLAEDLNQGVKTLSVDGKPPTANNYLLR